MKKTKYEYLCEAAEQLNELAKYEGSTYRYIVIREDDKTKKYRIVRLRKEEVK